MKKAMVARALLDWEAASPDELALTAGMRLMMDVSHVDASSGNVMAQEVGGSGRAGFVPLAANLLAAERAQAVMLADFQADGEGELSARQDEPIILLQSGEDVPEGWALAVARGNEVGFLPAAYTEEIGPPEAPKISSLPPMPTSASSSSSSKGVASSMGAAASSRGVYEALAEFEPEQGESDSSELALSLGDRMLLIEPPAKNDEESGWAQVELLGGDRAGLVGYVPYSHLQPAPSDGAMLSTFRGQTLGEASAAEEGEALWLTTPGAAATDGWRHVHMLSGVQGHVPDSYVGWGVAPFVPASQELNVASSQAVATAAATRSDSETDTEYEPASRAPSARVKFEGLPTHGGAPMADDSQPTDAPQSNSSSDNAPSSPDEEASDTADAAAVLAEQQRWVAEAKRMIVQAGEKPRKAVVALADFSAETEIDLDVQLGEKLWLFEGAEAPETWSIVERKAGGGDAEYRGLVPETYLGADEEDNAGKQLPDKLTNENDPDAQAVALLAEQQRWVAEAKRMIVKAGERPRKAVVALADFSAETEVDLDVQLGEKLWLCDGAEAPETWVVVERKAGGGDPEYRGLVPETFIGEDEAVQEGVQESRGLEAAAAFAQASTSTDDAAQAALAAQAVRSARAKAAAEVAQEAAFRQAEQEANVMNAFSRRVPTQAGILEEEMGTVAAQAAPAAGSTALQTTEEAATRVAEAATAIDVTRSRAAAAAQAESDAIAVAQIAEAQRTADAAKAAEAEAARALAAVRAADSTRAAEADAARAAAAARALEDALATQKADAARAADATRIADAARSAEAEAARAAESARASRAAEAAETNAARAAQAANAAAFAEAEAAKVRESKGVAAAEEHKQLRAAEARASTLEAEARQAKLEIAALKEEALAAAKHAAETARAEAAAEAAREAAKERAAQTRGAEAALRRLREEAAIEVREAAEAARAEAKAEAEAEVYALAAAAAIHAANGEKEAAVREKVAREAAAREAEERMGIEVAKARKEAEAAHQEVARVREAEEAAANELAAMQKAKAELQARVEKAEATARQEAAAAAAAAEAANTEVKERAAAQIQMAEAEAQAARAETQATLAKVVAEAEARSLAEAQAREAEAKAAEARSTKRAAEQRAELSRREAEAAEAVEAAALLSSSRVGSPFRDLSGAASTENRLVSSASAAAFAADCTFPPSVIQASDANCSLHTDLSAEGIRAHSHTSSELGAGSGGGGQRSNAYREELARREAERTEWEAHEAERRDAERRAYERLEAERREAEHVAFSRRIDAARREAERQETARKATLEQELTMHKERLAATWKDELARAEAEGNSSEVALAQAAAGVRAFALGEERKRAEAVWKDEVARAEAEGKDSEAALAQAAAGVRAFASGDDEIRRIAAIEGLLGSGAQIGLHGATSSLAASCAGSASNFHLHRVATPVGVVQQQQGSRGIASAPAGMATDFAAQLLHNPPPSLPPSRYPEGVDESRQDGVRYVLPTGDQPPPGQLIYVAHEVGSHRRTRKVKKGAKSRKSPRRHTRAPPPPPYVGGGFQVDSHVKGVAASGHQGAQRAVRCSGPFRLTAPVPQDAHANGMSATSTQQQLTAPCSSAASLTPSMVAARDALFSGQAMPMNHRAPPQLSCTSLGYGNGYDGSQPQLAAGEDPTMGGRVYSQSELWTLEPVAHTGGAGRQQNAQVGSHSMAYSRGQLSLGRPNSAPSAAHAAGPSPELRRALGLAPRQIRSSLPQGIGLAGGSPYATPSHL